MQFNLKVGDNSRLVAIVHFNHFQHNLALFSCWNRAFLHRALLSNFVCCEWGEAASTWVKLRRGLESGKEGVGLDTAAQVPPHLRGVLTVVWLSLWSLFLASPCFVRLWI